MDWPATRVDFSPMEYLWKRYHFWSWQAFSWLFYQSCWNVQTETFIRAEKGRQHPFIILLLFPPQWWTQQYQNYLSVGENFLFVVCYQHRVFVWLSRLQKKLDRVVKEEVEGLPFGPGKYMGANGNIMARTSAVNWACRPDFDPSLRKSKEDRVRFAINAAFLSPSLA